MQNDKVNSRQMVSTQRIQGGRGLAAEPEMRKDWTFALYFQQIVKESWDNLTKKDRDEVRLAMKEHFLDELVRRGVMKKSQIID